MLSVPADLDAVYDRAPLRLLGQTWDFCCLKNVDPGWHADVSKLDRGRRWAVRATFSSGWHMDFEPARADAYDAPPHAQLARLEFVREHGVKEVRVVTAREETVKTFETRLSPLEYVRAVELLECSIHGGQGVLYSVTIHSWPGASTEKKHVCVDSLSTSTMALFVKFF